MIAVGLAGLRADLDQEEESALEFLARIKIHNPADDGVLVELNGEFDISCLEALGAALDRARSLGEAVFVDLSGIGFMDALCTRELLRRSGDGAGRFELCQPSLEAGLSAAALGHRSSIKTCAPDDPAYEAVIREICRPRPEGDGARRTRRDLYAIQPSGAARDRPPRLPRTVRGGRDRGQKEAR